MIISLIAAMAENRVIGQNNTLPWNLPEDFRRFKALTTGHPVLMGRKTYQSMGKVLPDRQNIIITRNPTFHVKGATTVSSLQQALTVCKSQNPNQEIFVIGGQQIYEQALPLAQKIYLTIIHQVFEGDAFFPKGDFEKTFKILEEKRYHSKPPNHFDYTFLTAERARQ